ncbi:MAG: hypothetical protein M5U31_04400 [Acidimicrobiia bacterium]|nr:hypothetical protein [Acidimicrobiia bacterium]
MDFAEETQAERKAAGKPFDPVTERCDVIADFLDVVVKLGNALGITSLEAQEVGDIRLGSFDAGTEDRFKSDVGGDQEVGVREQASDAREAVQRTGGIIQETNELVGVGKAAWEGRWVIGPVPLAGNLARLTPGRVREVLTLHGVRVWSAMGKLSKGFAILFN